MASTTPGIETTDIEEYTADGIVASIHRPDGDPRGVLVLAHGAGGNRDAAVLRSIAEELSGERTRLVVARIDLPYRQRRPKGPPSPSTSLADRDGIRAAIDAFRALADGPVFVGGHSYGGRQASMVVAEDHDLVDGLLLSSYPLHPPGKPEKARTEHLPSITTPTLVIHGVTDTFGTSAEMAAAIDLIDAPTRIVDIERTGHSLAPTKAAQALLTERGADSVAALVATEFADFFAERITR